MMKYYLSISLAVLAVLGCEKVTPEETQTQPASGGTHVASLTFGVEQDGSRGIFLDDGKFQWSAGDQIGVYMYSSTLPNVANAGSGEYGPWIAPFDLTSGAGTGEGTFSRDLNDALGETYGNVAIYPFMSGSKYAYADDETKGTLTFNLPAKYEGLDNLDMVRIPMVARLDMQPGED